MSEIPKVTKKVQKFRPETYTVKILCLVREAQLTHGLRHNDYQLYRQYCSRRIRRLRKTLDLGQGVKKTFKKKETAVSQLKDERFIFIPLMILERYWAYAMQLKEESIQFPRKKFAMRNKLRKAAAYVVNFEQSVEACVHCDARTQLETQGYSAWLQGTVLFEMAEFTHEWNKPVEFFNKAYEIYSKLSETVADEEAEAYQHRLQELEVKLRYCRHHLGDKAATDKLLAMRENSELGAKLDKLVAVAREKQTSTLSEVSWKGRMMVVKHEKIRMFLLNESLLRDELKKPVKLHDFVDRFERLTMDAKDAIQLIKEDLKNDPTYKPRQATSKGPVSSLHFLHSYLSCLRLQLTVLRNLALHHSYRRQLSSEEKQEEGKKMPKYQDMVRLCDLNFQNLNEIPTLAGLEDDLELQEKLEVERLVYRVHKCFYIAEHLGKLEKWVEALAMYDKAAKLAAEIDNQQLESYLLYSLNVIRGEIKTKKYTAQAKVLLSEQSDDFDKSDKLVDFKDKYLIDHLDTFFEDESLLTNPRIAPVPPKMLSVPCKPLFFDLALNHVDFPSLDDKTGEKESNQGAIGGIRGLVKGLWGWGS